MDKKYDHLKGAVKHFVDYGVKWLITTLTRRHVYCYDAVRYAKALTSCYEFGLNQEA